MVLLNTTSKETGVYRLNCTESGFFYIGSTSDKRGFYARIKTHRNLLKHGKHHSPVFQHHFNRFGEEAFTFEILETCPPERCLEIEQRWLDEKGVGYQNKSYNLNPTASSQLGAKRSEESKRRMSIAQRGKKMPAWGPMSEEMKQRLRIANTGKTLSPATKAKISEANKRRIITPESTAGMHKWNKENPMTPEARRRLVEKAIEASSREYVITFPTGEEKEIKNLSAFCRKYNLSFSAMYQTATGNMISSKGWKCRFINETREEQDARIQAMPSIANSRKYIIFSPSEEEFRTDNLLAFCRQHGLCDSGMRAVARGVNTHHKNWSCVYFDESEQLREKRLSLKGKVGLEYIVTTPENLEIRIIGLVKFCKTHNLCPSTMTKVALKKLPYHKG